MTTALSSEAITAAAIISEPRFLQWLDTAKSGQSLTYHLGILLWDREHDHQIDRVGLAAWGAHQAGKVMLTQRHTINGTPYGPGQVTVAPDIGHTLQEQEQRAAGRCALRAAAAPPVHEQGKERPRGARGHPPRG